MLSHHLNINRVLLTILFLLVPTLGTADVVVPSDRVTSRVVVHEEPRANSADIGSLRPGEQLPYRGSVPRWHRVELPDGTRGFVSKSWTRIVRELAAREVDELRIHFLNVGAGTCTVVECPGANSPPMVIDCGSTGATPSDLDSDEARAYVQGILSQHTAQPNVVLSHADRDHYGWIPHVLQGTWVQNIWQGGDKSEYTQDGFPMWIAGQQTNGATVQPDPGDVPANWHNDGQPLGDDLDCGPASTFVLTMNTGSTKNSQSLVLMIEYEDFTSIFTGDATRATEAQAIANYPGGVRATVLSGSHHGASTHGSNSSDWARATAPDVTVFSAGRRFNHPRCIAVWRYTEFTAITSDHPAQCGDSHGYHPVQRTTHAEYMTEVNGAIIVTTDGQSPLSLHCTTTTACGGQIPF